MSERSEKQKEADKRYAAKIKGKYKTFQAAFLADEADYIRSVMEAHGIGNAELIRRAVARLEAGDDLK